MLLIGNETSEVAEAVAGTTASVVQDALPSAAVSESTAKLPQQPDVDSMPVPKVQTPKPGPPPPPIENKSGMYKTLLLRFK